MRAETKALLLSCQAAKVDALCVEPFIAEVRALHEKLDGVVAVVGRLRSEHALADLLEEDDSVRGEVYEMGAKLGGVERVCREAQGAVQVALRSLREFARLADRLARKHEVAP